MTSSLRGTPDFQVLAGKGTGRNSRYYEATITGNDTVPLTGSTGSSFVDVTINTAGAAAETLTVTPIRYDGTRFGNSGQGGYSPSGLIHSDDS